MPFAISLVANVFQTMIDYAVSVKAGTPNSEEFLKSMHQFGINYSCVGFVLFTCGYVGTALIDIAAINQVSAFLLYIIFSLYYIYRGSSCGEMLR